MSPFWRNFITNGASRREPVNTLREGLADACEQFFLGIKDLPREQRRRILLKELRRLSEQYRLICD